MDRLLRVNMTDLTVKDEPFPGAVFAVPKEEIMRMFERMPITDELRNMRAVG